LTVWLEALEKTWELVGVTGQFVNIDIGDDIEGGGEEGHHFSVWDGGLSVG
jgi:hypothetical protein